MVLRKEIWSLPRILWHFQVLFGLGELVVLGGVIEKLGPCQNTVRTDFATKIGFPSSKWLPYLPSLTWFRHAPSNNLYSIQSLLILPMGGDISKLFDFFFVGRSLPIRRTRSSGIRMNDHLSTDATLKWWAILFKHPPTPRLYIPFGSFWGEISHSWQKNGFNSLTLLETNISPPVCPNRFVLLQTLFL